MSEVDRYQVNDALTALAAVFGVRLDDGTLNELTHHVADVLEGRPMTDLQATALTNLRMQAAELRAEIAELKAGNASTEMVTFTRPAQSLDELTLPVLANGIMELREQRDAGNDWGQEQEELLAELEEAARHNLGVMPPGWDYVDGVD